MSNRKRNVEFARPEEPNFIKKLKAQVGYKEGPDINTKSEKLPLADSDDIEDKQEEQPVVVVLKSGDMTEDEVKQFKEQHKTESEEKESVEDKSDDKKIVFKKPNKADPSDTKSNLVQTSFHGTRDNKANSKQTPSKLSDDRKSIRNKSLLSFDEFDDEDS